MIDFHCHLDLYPDPEGVAREAQAAGIAVLSMTTTPSAFAGTAELGVGRPMIKTALGLHPELAHQRAHELALFDRLVADTRFVGEIGLDGSPRFAATRTSQLDALAHILGSCSDVGGRVLSVHSRGAVRPVLDALRGHPLAGTAVLHWFTGTARQASEAVELGHWFSIGPPMLASMKGRELVARLPRDRLLTETDGPFATNDGRPCTPSDVMVVTEQLARIWQVGVAEAAAQIGKNMSGLLAMGT